MSITLKETITHEVEIDGRTAYSTQLPKGMDPVEYDRMMQKLDELVRTEASAGRQGAEARFELAMRLRMECPELAELSWRQLVQVDAYKDGISHINAKYGKAKSAYSNHLAELREDKEQLRDFFTDNFPSLGVDDVKKLTDEWWLDPERPKTGGGKKKVLPSTVPGKVVVVDDLDTDELADDMTDASLVGLMSATTSKLEDSEVTDKLDSYPPEFLNQLNKLIRAAERMKAAYLTRIRTAG